MAPKVNFNSSFILKRELGPRNVSLDRMPWPQSCTQGCQMAIARFLDRMCLALRASGLWLRYATLQNLIPSFPWIAPPRPPPWRNPRKGRDQILPSGNPESDRKVKRSGEKLDACFWKPTFCRGDSKKEVFPTGVVSKQGAEWNGNETTKTHLPALPPSPAVYNGQSPPHLQSREKVLVRGCEKCLPALA